MPSAAGTLRRDVVVSWVAKAEAMRRARNTVTFLELVKDLAFEVAG